MIIETKFHIEGQIEDGTWHMIDRPVAYQADPRAHRAEVIRVLREHGITRYKKVRVAKYVTTIEIIGEDIPV